MLKQVSHLKILVQPEGNPGYSFFFFVIFDFLELREFFLFSGTLDTGFLEGGPRKSGRHLSYVPFCGIGGIIPF